MSTEDKNDVVMINLDRPRELRYGHKAIKKMLADTGSTIENIDIDNIDLEELEKYIYYGLLSDAKKHGETLELGMMEDLLDQAPNYVHITEKMTEALNIAFGGFVVPEGNPGAPAELPASGTGKNP
ncbi:hypothetical protein [Paenibacillus sp. FSL R7-0331]|uniref:hypothetical protein n=1 Tax=Paenibacillus sp. FSL R7-0331 TaxID=1536773 RepID=UPI0004F70F9C|nr:hypothetical protein [Paenibacillus sp. FSL R7-0331]AIQ54566.1 hypothetical protein R70331_25685 [Paenibacillus sp. FSL R7-0331]